MQVNSCIKILSRLAGHLECGLGLLQTSTFLYSLLTDGLFVGDEPRTVSKVNLSHYRPEVHRGFQELKVPRLRDNGPGWW